MRIRFEVVADQEHLDMVTVKGSTITYETGLAKRLMQATIDREGVRKAAQRFKNWSNGYVRSIQVANPPKASR